MNTPIRTSTMAILSLVFGVMCWSVMPFAGAILAIVFGHAARGELRRAAPGTMEGDGFAVAGLVLGYAQLAFCLLVLLVVFMFLGGLTFFGHFHS